LWAWEGKIVGVTGIDETRGANGTRGKTGIVA
jgi:hypothetical protein